MRSKPRFPSRLIARAGLSPSAARTWDRVNLSMAGLLMAAAPGLALIALVTDWDLALADAAFDTHINAFPLRHAWVTEVFNHVILKWLFSFAAVGFVVIALWDCVLPRPWSWLRRFRMRVVALSAVCVPALISIIKQMSDAHCPWDLERYGGAEPYVRLFESSASVVAGKCMPAGHASSALWLISLAVFFLPTRLSRAALTFAAFLVLGFAVGWLQQLRGAHFLTHTLWSLWFASAAVFLVIAIMDRWPVRPAQ